MRHENLIMTIKWIGSTLYSLFFSAIFVAKTNDSYQTVFTDPFFWAAAFIGMALMLLIENTDPKAPTVTLRRVGFSIVSCCAIIFIAGTIRAGMLDQKDFARSYFFYAIVLFACAIAPEMLRIIIGGSGKAIGDSVVKGIKDRTYKIVSGNNSEEQENNNTNDNK
jgi:hypothetical protein